MELLDIGNFGFQMMIASYLGHFGKHNLKRILKRGFIAASLMKVFWIMAICRAGIVDKINNTIMKEFNLEEAKAGKAVSTRNGRPARIICFDRKHNYYPIVALLTKSDGCEEYISYTIDGRFSDNSTKDSYDLMMVGEKKEGWINIYSNRTRSYIFDTKEKAIANIANMHSDKVVDTIKITWEE